MAELLSLPPLAASVDPHRLLQECRDAFLGRLGAILGEAGLSPPAVATVCAGSGHFFDKTAAAARAGFEQADGLTASSRLSSRQRSAPASRR